MKGNGVYRGLRTPRRQYLSEIVAEIPGGRVTVVQIAAETDLPLDDVSATLDEMTKKGYVMQDVLDNGVIAYEFPSIREE